MNPDDGTEEKKTKRLDEFTIIELKALAYDHIVSIDNTKLNLNTIEAMIQKRQDGKRE